MSLFRRIMPVSRDEQTNLRARLLYLALVTFAVYCAVLAGLSFLFQPDPMPLVISATGLILLCIVLLFPTRRGRTGPVAIVFVSLLWVFVTIIAVFNGGVTGAGPFNYVMVVTLAGLLLGLWPCIGVAVATVVALLIMVIAQAKGALPPVAFPSNPMSLWMTFSANILLAALYLGVSRRDAQVALTRARDSERDLRNANKNLSAAQEQLLQAQKMEAVGQLAGGVAHDFNNLLTAIQGYASLLQKKHDDWLELGEIVAAAQRGARLTGQLLAFSRKQIRQPRVIDFNAVVRDMDLMLQRLIGEQITLQTRLTPELFAIKADPGQMEQTLLNIALNARDAMPSGGTLLIETSNVTLSGEYVDTHADIPAGEYMMLAVSDTGVGIRDEDRSRIFEPFFTTKPSGKGVGLGLSTVFGIVKQSGGHIHIYSETDAGTTFKIYLPRVDMDAETAVETTEPVDARRGDETILVVEDEETVRSLTRQILEQRGYSVRTASCGEEAMEECKRADWEIDLLITDVVLPGGTDGPELVSQLEKEYPGLPVLFISGYTDNAIAHHGLLNPGVHFLQKPFLPRELHCKVRDLLDGQTE
jgi:signal transduction histidine kinase